MRTRKTYIQLLLLLLLPLSLSLAFSGVCQAQKYSIRDQEEIAYQAELNLRMYQDLLNVISYKDLASEGEIRELIRNSYSNSASQLFYGEDAVIEDNVKPSNLDAALKQDKSIKDYLNYFDLAYEKQDQASIDFYDFEVSHLKQGDYLYIKVKYSCLFRGKHKQDPTSYKAVDRVAELRVVKKDQAWKTLISSIVYYNPEKPLNSPDHNVELDLSEASHDTFAHYTEQVQKRSGTTAGAEGQEERFSAKMQEQDSLFSYHLEAGQQALANEQLEQAYQAFWEAEQIYPYHQELRKSLMELTRAQNTKISLSENSFEELKRKGAQAYRARDYKRAKNLYAEALRLNPGEDQLKVAIEKLDRRIRKTALLESKYAAGDYKAAIRDYHRAIKKDPKNPDYYYGRGKCYEKLNVLRKAFYDYSKAIELDPDFIEALSSRARLYRETGKLAKAVADYSLILTNPDYAAAYYPERARVKMSLGDWKGAIEDYQAAIRLEPDQAQHPFEVGMILLSQKNSRAALQAFGQAIQKNEQHLEAFYQRGFTYARLGNLQAAAADFESARALGLAEEQLGEINKLAFHHFTKAEGAMAEKAYHRALESFKDAILVVPDFGRAWLRKGDAYVKLGDYDQAIMQYDKAIKYEPLSFAYFKRGQAYQEKGDEQAAGEDFKRYIPIGKELLSRAGKKEPEIKPGTSLQGNFREDMAEAFYTLGYAQMMSRQYVEAHENLDRAIHLRKFYPEAYFARGSVLYALEDYRRAVKNMEESIRMGLNEPVAFFSLGRAYVANGQLKDAVHSFSHTIQLAPRYVAAYQERALCYKNFGQYELALEDIKTALSLNEALNKNVELITHKGLAELNLNMLRAAKQSFEQALRLDEHHGWALYGKACVLAKEQKTAEALILYRQAFQSRQIDWQAIKNDPLIDPVSKDKDFKKLVKTYF